MAAARTLCQAHEDLANDTREIRKVVGDMSQDMAVVRAAIEQMSGLPDRVTHMEAEMRMTRRADRRWSGVLPTVVASVVSSGITGAVVYLISMKST